MSQSGYFAWEVVQPASVSATIWCCSPMSDPRSTVEWHLWQPADDARAPGSGPAMGRRRTARLMHENGLKARQKRRFKRTTDSQHAFPIAPNLHRAGLLGQARTRNGARIFRTSGPVRGGSTWPWSSIYSRARWLAGRSAIVCTGIWLSRRCVRLSRSGVRVRG